MNKPHGEVGSLTPKQHETILATLRNYYYATRYEVSVRSSQDCVIHVFDKQGETIFHAKINPDGAYN